jgi:hypothetical protein
MNGWGTVQNFTTPSGNRYTCKTVTLNNDQIEQII